MSDDALTEFHQELVAEVEEGLSTEEPFSANIFTRLILERLEEAGHFDSTFPLYQEGPIRNTRYRIDGYTYDEDRARLDLFTTIYSGDLTASKIPAADITR
ncbi:AIPR protein, partial [Pseudomonas kairouanensis]